MFMKEHLKQCILTIPFLKHTVCFLFSSAAQKCSSVKVPNVMLDLVVEIAMPLDAGLPMELYTNEATWTYIRQTIQSMEFMNSFANHGRFHQTHIHRKIYEAMMGPLQIQFLSVHTLIWPDRGIFLQKVSPIGSMGMVYLPTLIPQKSTIHVPKYTSPMNAMGLFNL